MIQCIHALITEWNLNNSDFNEKTCQYELCGEAPRRCFCHCALTGTMDLEKGL